MPALKCQERDENKKASLISLDGFGSQQSDSQQVKLLECGLERLDGTSFNSNAVLLKKVCFRSPRFDFNLKKLAQRASSCFGSLDQWVGSSSGDTAHVVGVAGHPDVALVTPAG